MSIVMAHRFRSIALLRRRCYQLLFDNYTRSGRRMEAFWVLTAILSVIALFFESSARTLFPHTPNIMQFFGLIELGFTAIFTVEYVLRIFATPSKERYPLSFFGLVDLLTILPLYILWLFPSLVSTGDMVVLIRLMRILRVLRVLKLLRYMNEAGVLWRSLMRARHKLTLFFGFVAIILCLFGGLMFAIEGGRDGFTSLGTSVYWAVVTLTTVGYGDITPHTPLGRVLASILILLGYSIIAVPTGILTAYMSQELQKGREQRSCRHCHHIGHELDARFCDHCGTQLPTLRSQLIDKKPNNRMQNERIDD
ncbi:ion transporter [Ewingella americana]|jgi:voltage-gated potassium channel|nr:ion transporter [Ewingella americana]